MDGNAVLRLASEHGAAAAARLLDRQSGFLALAGGSDLRVLRRAKIPEAEFAIAHFCYWVARHVGSLIAAMGGVDALAFTSGVGQNDPAVCANIIQRLAWVGLDPDPAAHKKGDSGLHRRGSKAMAQSGRLRKNRRSPAKPARFLEFWHGATPAKG